MQDAITNILNKYDLTGKYLDKQAINKLEEYFDSGLERIRILEFINSNTQKIVKEAATQLYNEQPELLRPGGNSYTTRRYTACLRDIEYYLRYSSYALIADNNNILNERVLNGLKDTYNSLGVPIGPTVRSIQLLEEIIEDRLNINSESKKTLSSKPFNYLINTLSEQDR